MQRSSANNNGKEKTLVVGVDGIVGSNVALALSDRFAVLGLALGDQGEAESGAFAVRRAGDLEELAADVESESPQWILYCGPLAQNSWDLAGQTPDLQREVETCRTLARLAGQLGSRLTLVITDAACGGPWMYCDEKDPLGGAEPIAVADEQIRQAVESLPALVVRTHAYGWSPGSGRLAWAERVWEALAAGDPCPPPGDRYASPILATDLAELLVRAHQLGLTGLYHFAGAERASAYHFAGQLAAACGFRNGQRSTQRPPGNGSTDVPLETSLDTRRARRDLALPMPMLREGLDRFAAQAEDGFRARLKSGAPVAA
jgi:dTDP-4-dehydrorhamnose reductase